jgi:hypothetical protein
LTCRISSILTKEGRLTELAAPGPPHQAGPPVSSGPASPDGSPGGEQLAPSTPGVDLALLRWHIERYDRLRASTASRAAVVLSAGAILSAGNAVVLSQVFGGSYDDLDRRLVIAFTVAVMVSAAMVVVSIIRAASVLVTPRASRSMFAEPTGLPPSLLFNGTDTVARAPSFEAFRSAVAGLTEADMLTAAQVELYINIRQHRHRYDRLRDAVRLLRYSAVAFLLVLAAGVTVNIIGRL